MTTTTPDPNWTPWGSGYTLTGRMRWYRTDLSGYTYVQLQQEWADSVDRVWWSIPTVIEVKETSKEE
jgi:hypothetical protein